MLNVFNTYMYNYTYMGGIIKQQNLIIFIRFHAEKFTVHYL